MYQYQHQLRRQDQRYLSMWWWKWNVLRRDLKTGKLVSKGYVKQALCDSGTHFQDCTWQSSCIMALYKFRIIIIIIKIVPEMTYYMFGGTYSLIIYSSLHAPVCLVCTLSSAPLHIWLYHHHHQSSSSSHSQRGPSHRSSMMTASKGLSPEVGRCLAGVVSDLVDPSATWATRPTTPGGMRKTTEWEVHVGL